MFAVLGNCLGRLCDEEGDLAVGRVDEEEAVAVAEAWGHADEVAAQQVERAAEAPRRRGRAWMGLWLVLTVVVTVRLDVAT